MLIKIYLKKKINQPSIHPDNGYIGIVFHFCHCNPLSQASIMQRSVDKLLILTIIIIIMGQTDQK